MKRLLTLALAFVTLAALIGLGVAQQQKAGLNNPTGGLPTPTPFQTAPPGGTFSRCPQGSGVEYLGGVVDDFGGGNDPVTTSPELEAYLIGLGSPGRQFDEGGANKNFGHSFQLRENCKVCAVRFEIKMRAEGNGPENDEIFFYGKTITLPDQIWQAPIGLTGSGAPGTFILIASLPPAAIDLLNKHIVTDAPGHWLNIFAQDDHAFDYVKVRITYY